jgi:hypothetical protein
MSILKKNKTLFMILGSDAPENQMDLKMQRETWLNELLPNQKYLVIRGSNQESARLQEDNLLLPVIESYENILRKTLLGFHWALENTDFEVLIRTNVSTYFPVKLVDKEVEVIEPSSHFFGGYIDECWIPGNPDRKKISFVAGTAIVLTRPTVELLCQSNLGEITELPDDVAISIAINNLRIPAQNFKRNNLGSSHFFYPKFQIRVKTSSVSHLASKRMKNVHEYFQAANLIDKYYCYLKISINEMKYVTTDINQLFTFFGFVAHQIKRLVTKKSIGNLSKS